jgi:hypothetical protein
MPDLLFQDVDKVTGYCESNLVVQAARAFLSGVEEEDLQATLAQTLHWETVEHVADRHAVLPLLIYVLNQYGASAISREASERFQWRWAITSRNSLIQMQEWHEVLQAFEMAGLSVISLKGPTLALLAYRNAILREFTDLDFLIQPKDIPAARDVLVREGYRLRSPGMGDTEAAMLRSRNRQLDFINDARGTVVDLHWGALHEMFSFQLPLEQVFESSKIEYRDGQSFLSLSPEYLLLYLCAHGTKHCWLRLRDLCDIALYVVSTPALDWELCLTLSKSANCDLVLKHALLLARKVLGLELPLAIRNYCEDAEAQALADTAQSFLFRETDHIGYREALHYHLAFAKDWKSRVRFLFQRVLVPAEEDWQDVRLPQSLYLLYYLIRPIRLLLKALSNIR